MIGLSFGGGSWVVGGLMGGVDDIDDDNDDDNVPGLRFHEKGCTMDIRVLDC